MHGVYVTSTSMHGKWAFFNSCMFTNLNNALSLVCYSLSILRIQSRGYPSVYSCLERVQTVFPILINPPSADLWLFKIQLDLKLLYVTVVRPSVEINELQPMVFNISLLSLYIQGSEIYVMLLFIFSYNLILSYHPRHEAFILELLLCQHFICTIFTVTVLINVNLKRSFL